MPCVCLLLCCLFPLFVHAQSVVTFDANGKLWFTPSGSSTGIPVDRVIYLGGPTGPTDPPIDPPTETSELKKLSMTWVSKVESYPKRSDHRQSLASVYSLLGEESSLEKFESLDQLGVATKVMRDAVLGARGRVEWREWGLDVGAYLSANVPTLAGAGPAYSDVAAGLSLPGEAIGPGLKVIIKIILTFVLSGTDLNPAILELITELLERFFG